MFDVGQSVECPWAVGRNLNFSFAKKSLDEDNTA
jgi:hypothetical protein